MRIASLILHQHLAKLLVLVQTTTIIYQQIQRNQVENDQK